MLRVDIAIKLMSRLVSSMANATTQVVIMTIMLHWVESVMLTRRVNQMGWSIKGINMVMMAIIRWRGR